MTVGKENTESMEVYHRLKEKTILGDIFILNLFNLAAQNDYYAQNDKTDL
jgi:hypothetical protein